MIDSLFETPGVWKISDHRLTYAWAEKEEFTPTELDVPFWFGDHYNWSQSMEVREAWLKANKIKTLIEIVEVFREPRHDVDSGWKGDSFLVARFDNVADAIYFKMSVPAPQRVRYLL